MEQLVLFLNVATGQQLALRAPAAPAGTFLNQLGLITPTVHNPGSHTLFIDSLPNFVEPLSTPYCTGAAAAVNLIRASQSAQKLNQFYFFQPILLQLLGSTLADCHNLFFGAVDFYLILSF